MSAVINLRHEPKLREQFEYKQVVNNTVLIDRRTKWGNPYGEQTVMESGSVRCLRAGDYRTGTLTITTRPFARRPRPPAACRAHP